MGSYALIELQHIQLELKNNRFHHLRHFVDQYYCYENGYVSSSGKAKWDDLLWKEIVSVNALKTSDKKEVVKEHVVPLKVITDQLRELVKKNRTSIEDIKETLDEYIVFATITKEEDRTLREKGLNHKMPNEFYEKENPLYGNLYARYKIAGIEYRIIKS